MKHWELFKSDDLACVLAMDLCKWYVGIGIHRGPGFRTGTFILGPFAIQLVHTIQ